jgi:hypothetical protein
MDLRRAVMGLYNCLGSALFQIDLQSGKTRELTMLQH